MAENQNLPKNGQGQVLYQGPPPPYTVREPVAYQLPTRHNISTGQVPNQRPPLPLNGIRVIQTRVISVRGQPLNTTGSVRNQLPRSQNMTTGPVPNQVPPPPNTGLRVTETRVTSIQPQAPSTGSVRNQLPLPLSQNMIIGPVPNQLPPPPNTGLRLTQTRVTSVQPQAPIFRTPEDETYISSIRQKAVRALCLSILATFCVWPIVCSIPAIVLAIMSLAEKTNIGTADSYAKGAYALSRVGAIFGGALFVLSIIYLTNSEDSFSSY